LGANAKRIEKRERKDIPMTLPIHRHHRAGPQGFTAGYLLSKENVPVTILEADPTYVGASHARRSTGLPFDIGGHRFFSIVEGTSKIFGQNFYLTTCSIGRDRRASSSRSFSPIRSKGDEALFKLFLESTRCVLSYIKASLLPVKNPKNFETGCRTSSATAVQQFSSRPTRKKSGGMSCKFDISADWAAQRIKKVSLSSAIWNALFRVLSRKRQGIEQGHQDADRHLPLSAPGPRHDVGCRRRQDQGDGGEIEMGMKVSPAITMRPPISGQRRIRIATAIATDRIET